MVSRISIIHHNQGVKILDLNTAILNLATTLKTTPQFSEFSKARQALENTSEGKLLADFENKQRRLYEMGKQMQNAESYSRELENEFQTLAKIPAINRYFTTQEAFQKLIDSTMNNLFNLL